MGTLLTSFQTFFILCFGRICFQVCNLITSQCLNVSMKRSTKVVPIIILLRFLKLL